MFKKITTNVALFILFFLICAVIASYSATYEFTHHPLFPTIQTFTTFLQLPATEFAKNMGASDMATYINSANFFLKNGHFEDWSINLWPPGHPLILATIFKLTGENDYPLKMLLLTITAWSLTLVFVYNSITRIKNFFIKTVLTFTPFYFATFRAWIFGNGIFLSEAISLPLFILSACLFLNWLRTKKTSNLVAMATTLAITAYLRGYFEIYGNFMIYILLAILITKILWMLITEIVKSPNASIKQAIIQTYKTKDKIFDNKSKALITAAIVFIVLLLPWRLYNHFERGTSFAWQHMDYAWLSFWTPDSAIPPGFGDTSANVACHVKPKISPRSPC